MVESIKVHMRNLLSSSLIAGSSARYVHYIQVKEATCPIRVQPFRANMASLSKLARFSETSRNGQCMLFLPKDISHRFKFADSA